MADIKLFVCCHQPTAVPAHPLLVPIQVGAALADVYFPGFLHDDTGDNISHKNRSYCELTAQYWAWKNVEADYYGFFHYRRYLYPVQQVKHPYCIEKEPSLNVLNKLGYSRFSQLIQQYDLILPKGENMYVPVREHYASAPFHHTEDLTLAEQIMLEQNPGIAEAGKKYFAGTICYFGNIYIMKREMFHSYCAWLFPILEEFDRQANFSSYGPQERRVNGYLAERLLGVYAVHEKEKNVFRIAELPRVHFAPKIFERWRKQVLGAMLPPGSQRRAFWKNVCK